MRLSKTKCAVLLEAFKQFATKPYDQVTFTELESWQELHHEDARNERRRRSDQLEYRNRRRITANRINYR